MVFQLHLGTDTVVQASPLVPVCIESGASVRAVLQKLQSLRQGCCLVCRDGRLIGVYTERDAVRLMATATASSGSGPAAKSSPERALDAPVDDVMSRDPVTIGPNDSLESAIAIMAQRGFRQLPVVDDQQKPVGVLPVASILHYLVQHFPQYVYNLPPFPHHATQQREGA